MQGGAYLAEPPSPIVRVAADAMGTRIEVALVGRDEHHARAAGEEALAEFDRLDRAYSVFRRESILTRLARAAGGEPVPICSETLALLEVAKDVWQRSLGAFDPTVGPLMHSWGFRDSIADWAAPAPGPAPWGCADLHLDAQRGTARLARPGMSLDLGAIVKGWAVDAAIEVLRRAGITRAILHAGTSSVGAVGTPPELPGWRVRVCASGGARDVFLCDRALSVSAPSGQLVERDGRRRGHLIDPRTGIPTPDLARVAVCIHESATLADAWSTALLVRGSLEGLGTPVGLVWAVSIDGAWRTGGPDADRIFLPPSPTDMSPEFRDEP